jgi:hypothetical protein
MNMQNQFSFEDIVAEAPDKQPPAKSYPEPGETAPLNPNPEVPGPDAPEVNTGSRIDDDLPAQDTDEDEVDEIQRENP